MIDRKLINLAIEQAQKQALDESMGGDVDCILENFIDDLNERLDFIEKMLEITGTPTNKNNSNFLSRPICDAITNAHAVNPLIKAGYRVMGDVVKKTSQELLDAKGFGDGGLKAVQAVLRENGYELGVKPVKTLV